MKRKVSSFPRRPGRGISTRTALVSLGVGLAALTPVLAGQASANDLSVSGAWFRTIVPGRPAGGYFTLENDGDATRQLVAASSAACGVTMLHQSVSENGQDKMVMVNHIDVPGHGSITFAPGGYHIMCMSPKDEMKPGNTVQVTLKFGDGANLTADFAVKSATGD